MEICHYKDDDKSVTVELDREALAILGDATRIALMADSLWQEEIWAKGGEIFLLREGKTVIGMCSYCPVSSKDVELKKFRVRGDRQGGGHGSMLLDHVERAIKERGFARIVLETSALREKTLSFYLRRGYARLGEREVNGMLLVDFEKWL